MITHARMIVNDTVSVTSIANQDNSENMHDYYIRSRRSFFLLWRVNESVDIASDSVETNKRLSEVLSDESSTRWRAGERVRDSIESMNKY